MISRKKTFCDDSVDSPIYRRKPNAAAEVFDERSIYYRRNPINGRNPNAEPFEESNMNDRWKGSQLISRKPPTTTSDDS
eukprot:scaffold23668_cov127-Cylindrotheca_fusiformis.AAC.1